MWSCVCVQTDGNLMEKPVGPPHATSSLNEPWH